jgi:uncharacterized protein involved in exopolysaccharide biosynthesis
MSELLNKLQEFFTVMERLERVAAEMERERAERERFVAVLTARLDRLDTQLGDARDRILRLEASRDADRAQAAAELARFMAEVERAETRLVRALSGARPSVLPSLTQPDDPEPPAP